MSRKAVDSHYDHFVKRLFERFSSEANKGIKGYHVDSYEAGWQNWTVAEDGLEFQTKTPTDIANAVRLLLDAKPSAVQIDGETSGAWHWDDASKTLLIQHQGNPKGTHGWLLRIEG